MGLQVRRRMRDVWDVMRMPWFRQFSPEGIDWSRAGRWVFVCHGNLCRSPFGECWARQRGIAAASCGLQAIDDKPADPVAVERALVRGVDMRAHRGTPLLDMALNAQDLVVLFDPDHVPACLEYVRPAGAQLVLLGLALDRPRLTIADPFGRPSAFFDAVFESTEAGLDALAAAMARARASAM